MNYYPYLISIARTKILYKCSFIGFLAIQYEPKYKDDLTEFLEFDSDYLYYSSELFNYDNDQVTINMFIKTLRTFIKNEDLIFAITKYYFPSIDLKLYFDITKSSISDFYKYQITKEDIITNKLNDLLFILKYCLNKNDIVMLCFQRSFKEELNDFHNSFKIIFISNNIYAKELNDLYNNYSHEKLFIYPPDISFALIKSILGFNIQIALDFQNTNFNKWCNFYLSIKSIIKD